MTTTPVGQSMHAFITQLYPLCRSLSGPGVVDTLKRIQQEIPLTIQQVASGTKVLDWTVPLEWQIKDAYVKNSRGERVIDFHQSNLHVVSYSQPVHKKMSLAELRPHLFSLPDKPTVIPYRTSYYEESWGFCLSHNDLLTLTEDEYEVVIDSKLFPGFLRYGEYVIKGQTDEEIVISTHICHPSLCNDNLSGIAVATWLAKVLGAQKNYYSFRFLFIPGTIGSLTWLAQHQSHIKHIKHGLVLTGVGDKGQPTYKCSRQGTATTDLIMKYVLRTTHDHYQIRDFSPFGYDERQFCSPGFNLPVGCFMRTPHGEYPQYHTSADNLAFVTPASLNDSLDICLKWANTIDSDITYVNVVPKGEPQLGKRGLYQAMAQQSGQRQELQMALLWLLNYSDGQHSLTAIAELSQLSIALLQKAAQLLTDHQLLRNTRKNHPA